MIFDTDMLPKIATVLEKVAEYIENVESTKLAADKNRRVSAATELAEKLSTVTGEHFDKNVVDKLANLDPEIAEMIGKFAGGSTGVDSMGGPDDRMSKTASAGIGSAEANFLSWVVGP